MHLEEYETYTYNLPVPIVDNAYPFYARATLVYFPQCDRNQGVDYTSTEMDIHFGRVVVENRKVKIKPIDNNRQSEDKFITLYEEDARKMYRKSGRGLVYETICYVCIAPAIAIKRRRMLRLADHLNVH